MSQNDRTLNPRPPLTTDMRVSLQIGPRDAASTVLTAVAAAALLMGIAACTPSAGAADRATAAGTTATASAGAHAPDTASATLDHSRILGDTTARVWFIMISDFQCPYCKQFHDESFAALRNDYVATGKVRMAYINFPLPIHQNAWPAAEAAMCAGAQGKFWPMHDVLFSAQEAWAEQHPAVHVIDSLATTIGVDTIALDRCVSQHVSKALIDADADRAERAGARSTPTVIIGSKVLVGVQPLANYRRELDSALAKAK
jgi:protein-disulfide isomerase